MDDRRRWIALNVVGGGLVLASYAWGLRAMPAEGPGLWGGIPDALRPFYTVNMLLAAAGYFLFAQHIARADPRRARIGEAPAFARMNRIFAAILLPSALWLPLTAAMLAAPSDGLWMAILIDLWTVGLASLALLHGLLYMQPHPGRLSRRLALLGALPFALQTAVLDALVWPLFFPR